MKLRHLVIPALALFIVAGCNKKKEAKQSPSTSKAKKQTQAKKSKTTPKKEPGKTGKKQATKPVVPVKSNTLKPSLPLKGKPCGELGVPKIAMSIDLEALVSNEFVKALLTKHEKAVKVNFMDNNSFVKVMSCLGSKATKPYEVFKKIYIFGNAIKKEHAVLIKVDFDTNKFLGCALKNNKRAKKAKFGGKDAVAIKGQKLRIIPVAKDTLLIASGAYLKSVKPGQGKVGTGQVADYFKQPGWITFFLNDIATSKIPGNFSGIIGKIASISANGSVGMTDTLKLQLNMDVKAPAPAQQLFAFANTMLNSPMATKQIKLLGLDPKLLKKLKLSVNGSVISLLFSMEKSELRNLISVLEKQTLMKKSGRTPKGIVPAKKK